MNDRHEKQRLEALKSYALMDTEPDELLDNITALAAEICGTSISLISLLDENRQWFKARVGLDVSETPRELAFCNHAIRQHDLMEVKDATKDDRFANNPLVTEEPHIRYYAGYPLVDNEGYALGTLCTIDTKPHELTDSQKGALKMLADIIISIFESKRQHDQLREIINLRQEFIQELNYKLRTPLNAVVGLTKILEEKNKEEVLKEDFSLLDRSVDEMVDAVNAFTDMNALTEESVKFNLNDILSRLFDKIQDKKNIGAKLIYDFTIPQVLTGNVSKVKKIFYHLISSLTIGRKHTDLICTVENLGNNDGKIALCFEFEDTSVEVQPKDSKNSLRQRLDKNVALELINSMGGSLRSLASKMVVEFSLTSVDKDKKQDKTPSTNNISGLKVLLVDDLMINQKITGKFLSSWNVDFTTASNGLEAVEAVAKDAFDVVLMDLRMPVMDGYTAISEIKTMEDGKYKELPIIALTASVSESRSHKMKKLGLFDFITKPFNPEELKHKIGKALKNKNLK